MMINKRLIGLCEESKKYMILTVVANWIALLCNISIILWIGQFINKLIVHEEVSLLSMLSLILFLGGRFISNLYYGKFSALASENAKVRLRDQIYKKLLRLGTNYQQVDGTSSFVQIMVEGVEQLEVYFGRYLPQFFYALLAPLTLFVVILPYSFKAALILLISVPLIPISIIAIMKIAKRILKNYWKSYSNLGGTFLENLQGLTTLKVFNQDEERHQKMNQEAEDFRIMTMKVLSMQLNSINIMDLVAFGGAAAGTITALIQYSRGEILVGHLLIITLLSAEFFIPMRLLGSYFHIAMNGMAASDRIFKVLDAKEPEEVEKSTIKVEESIALENVEFSYDETRPILKQVSLAIKPTNLTAIVGESGSGKSTVASLLMKTYKVHKGNIKWGEVNFNDISSSQLYNHMTLVSTNSYIMGTTIRENLLMAKLNATDEEIKVALELAQLSEFVSSLKEGLDTPVGEGGNLLSGGQKQRLALARAILANREVMIFDEATSNIDIESEEAIWKAIHELAKTKAVLVISHRLVNVKHADCIYVMKQGEVVESGTHESLYANQSEYFRMVNKQNELEQVREVE
ncbi:ABC transporter ATP-binding protein/permease [Niameybacter massiliensis]|uniref:ABC transporter ATP-binding protein/permease n=1 Tax=Holtiella tumoricola TaxID=3018743 RepID=A0AA42IYS9_9FIRM|nr:ABC transporter ATP-binding protein/permease [Holtiella tumoricola]MDA3730142.1 ABC transporter ATP-binding protein/permease [Holtiella tumoricola]